MFGTSATDKAPPGPRITLVFPAATACPAAVLNVGQEINSVPPASVPSARYTTSLIVLLVGVCDRAALNATSTNASK